MAANLGCVPRLIHPLERLRERTRRRQFYQTSQFHVAPHQTGHIVLADELRIDPNLNLVAGQLIHNANYVEQRNPLAAADVYHL